MKTLALACGLSALALSADAATYKFSFVSEPMQPTEECFEYDPDYGPDCEPGYILRAQIIARLPDLVSRRLDMWLEPVSDDDDHLVKLASNYPVLSIDDSYYGGPGIEPFELYGYFFYASIQTDAQGRIVHAAYDWGEEAYMTSIFGSQSWIGGDLTYFFEAPGQWSVSPVPVPAGGALLLASVCGLALVRRRRS